MTACFVLHLYINLTYKKIKTHGVNNTSLSQIRNDNWPSPPAVSKSRIILFVSIGW